MPTIEKLKRSVRYLCDKYNLSLKKDLPSNRKELCALNDFFTFYGVSPSLAFDVCKSYGNQDIVLKYINLNLSQDPYSDYEHKIKVLCNELSFDVKKDSFPIQNEDHCKIVLNFLRAYKKDSLSALTDLSLSPEKQSVVTSYITKRGYSK